MVFGKPQAWLYSIEWQKRGLPHCHLLLWRYGKGSSFQGPSKNNINRIFNLCRADDFAKTLFYVDVPKYYTWNKKSWNKRKQGTDVAGFPGVKEACVLGRIYTISPRQGECFYLRLLLHHVRGPQSFSDLKTINGDLCSSFRRHASSWVFLRMTISIIWQCKRHQLAI